MFTDDFKLLVAALLHASKRAALLIIAGGLLFKVAVPGAFQAFASTPLTSPLQLARALIWPTIAVVPATFVFFRAARWYGKGHQLWQRAKRRVRRRKN